VRVVLGASRLHVSLVARGEILGEVERATGPQVMRRAELSFIIIITHSYVAVTPHVYFIDNWPLQLGTTHGP